MEETLITFFDYLRADDHSERTISSYRSDLAAFLQWFATIHNRDPQPPEVTPLDVREYRDHLTKTRQMKPTSINRHLATLRSYFKWAYNEGLVASNPMAGIKSMRLGKQAPQWLARTETFALLRAASEAVQLAEAKQLKPTAILARRDQAIIALMLHAGLRVSEVCELRVSDVTLKPRSGFVVVRFGKGRKYREVPLNNDARHALRGWLTVYPDDLSKSKKKQEKYMFMGRRGVPLKPRGVQRLLDKLVVSARLTDKSITPHTLRHTFGKNLVNAGVPLDRVSMLLGHESLDTTAIYTTPSQADLEAAVEQIAWRD